VGVVGAGSGEGRPTLVVTPYSGKSGDGFEAFAQNVLQVALQTEGTARGNPDTRTLLTSVFGSLVVADSEVADLLERLHPHMRAEARAADAGAFPSPDPTPEQVAAVFAGRLDLMLQPDRMRAVARDLRRCVPVPDPGDEAPSAPPEPNDPTFRAVRAKVTRGEGGEGRERRRRDQQRRRTPGCLQPLPARPRPRHGS
jgi:hypothetical protein